MVGISGVGKTTLLSRVVAVLKEGGRDAAVLSFGTMMLEGARERGIADRDELRKQPVGYQAELQRRAARSIAAHAADVVIVDTHAFISSPEGYYPGLPRHVLDELRPTNFVLVSAKPEEIYSRRIKDGSRHRDKVRLADIKKEMDVQSGMMSACAVLTGAPVRHILNGEGRVDDAASAVIRAVGL